MRSLKVVALVATLTVTLTAAGPVSRSPSTYLGPILLLETTGATVNISNLGAIEMLSPFGPVVPPPSMDFPADVELLPGDPGHLYQLTAAGSASRYSTSGINTLLPPVAPPPGQRWTDLAFDSATGRLYGVSVACGTTAILSIIEPVAGTATGVGIISNATCVIGLAADRHGDLYGYDLLSDALLLIDKATGAGKLVGPLGFDANYGQSMDCDPSSGTCYLFAFNAVTLRSELRSVDLATGWTTLVGVIGASAPGGTVHVAGAVFGAISTCKTSPECNDGDPCNGTETCANQACRPGTAVDCDDGVPCTLDVCDPSSGSCSHAPDPCNDGDVCTRDSCLPSTGCVHEFECVQFCNLENVTIQDGPSPSTPAEPYPSLLTVSGMGSGAVLASVELNGVAHTFPDDLDLLLEAPGGQNAIILSDVGGSFVASGVDLTLTDSAATSLPNGGPLLSGTYRPANFGGGDFWPPPAPPASGGSSLSVFTGANPNGTWRLFVVDDAQLNSGTIGIGWCLRLKNTCSTDASCDDGNPCTVALCDPATGCTHVVESSRPGEAPSLSFAADKQTLSWISAPGAVVHDVLRGGVHALPVGPGGAEELCFDDLGSLQLTDPSTPPAGAAFWYVARGENGCGEGPFGTASGGLERSSAGCSPCRSPAIALKTPGPDTIVSTDQMVAVLATLSPPFDDPLLVANTEVFADRPGFPPIPIASGDIRPLSQLRTDRFALWDLTGVPSGDYLITVRVTPHGCGVPSQIQVPVTVNQAPEIADIQVLGCVPAPSTCGDDGFCVAYPETACAGDADCMGRGVSFRAIVSDPDVDPVDRLIWNAGNERTAVITSGTMDFTAAYAPGTGTAIVDVTAIDARGGTAEIARDLDVPNCIAAPTTNCGCKNMKIWSQKNAKSYVYCFTEKEAAVFKGIGCYVVKRMNPDSFCPDEKTEYRCPLGPLTPGKNFSWTFEVDAQLTDNTDDTTQCSEGQYCQVEAKWRGGAIGNAKTNDGPEIPPGGVLNLPGGSGGAGGTNFNVVEKTTTPLFDAKDAAGVNPKLGADDYQAQRNFKRHIGKERVQWLDSVGFIGNVAPGDAMDYKARFLSYVKGNKGTCWCYIEVKHIWAANGPRTGDAQVKKLAGHNCTVHVEDGSE